MAAVESDSAPTVPICVADLENYAKSKLDEGTWCYYHNGAADEITRRENVEAFDRLKIRPRTMRNVARIDTRIRIWGKEYPYPICVSPSAVHRIAHNDGELATSRAVASQGLTMALSTFSSTSLEEVISAGQQYQRMEGIPPPEYWLQLYCFQNRKMSEWMIRRAEASGYKAIVLTVDTPYLGRRYCELRSKFTLPPHVRPANFDADKVIHLPYVDDDLEQDSVAPALYDKPNIKQKIGRPISGPLRNENDPSISWEETIPWLKSITSLKVIVKVWKKDRFCAYVQGILTAEDAKLAVEQKVDGIWVSNHGGRQLDTCPSSLDALPEIVEALRPSHPEIPIFLDSGIARGTDVFKALALGADLCFIGRPTLWGLVYGGQNGAEFVLETLENELRLTMALAGARNLREITRSHLGYVKDGVGIQPLG